MKKQQIAYVRIQGRTSPDPTYRAVRTSALPAVLAEADAAKVVEQVTLELPSEITAKLAAELAENDTALVGTVLGGVWISGPLAGHRCAPYQLEGRYQCTHVDRKHGRCDLPGIGLKTCLVHSPPENPKPLPRTLW